MEHVLCNSFFGSRVEIADGKGKEVTISAPAPQCGGKVVNIMKALKRSMERIPAKKKPATTAEAKKKKNVS